MPSVWRVHSECVLIGQAFGPVSPSLVFLAKTFLHLLAPSLVPFLAPFLVGRVPLLNSTTEKVGTLILSSLLEDLGTFWSRGQRQV